MNLAVNVLSADSLITAFGLAGVFFIIFAETGLLLGFFLPGDSLLFLAGFFASTSATATGHLPLPWLLLGVPIAAIAGAQVGYEIGAATGHRLFQREDSRLFKKAHVRRAEAYFNRFGPAKAVVLARFVPVVRTFLNPLAGVLEMPRRSFTLWNALGGVVWSLGVTLAGYGFGRALGAKAKNVSVDRYLVPAVVVVIVISGLPILVELIRTRRRGRRETEPDTVGDETRAG